MTWQFCIIIRFFFQHFFKTNNVSFLMYQTYNFFLKIFCMTFFFVHFFTFFFKSNVMENLVEFYLKNHILINFLA
jgi:hypothetical protein